MTRWRLCCIAALGFAAACSRSDTAAIDTGSRDSTVRTGKLAPVTLVVADCRPCRIPIARGAPPFELVFVVDSADPGPRVVGEVIVRRPDRTGWSQYLTASEMPTAFGRDSFYVTGEDIDFDGNNDLALLTSKGAANAYASYWVYRAQADSFAYLGNYPVFSRDTVARELSTYERGGNAGLLYERRRYRFAADTLAVIEVEKQEATGRAGRYRKTLSRVEGGTLRVVRVDTVVAGK